MSFSRLLPLDGFQFIFLMRDSENDLLHLIGFRATVTQQACSNPRYRSDVVSKSYKFFFLFFFFLKVV